jgi:hypothetical protein
MPPSAMQKADLGRNGPVARRLNYPQPVFNLKILAAISNAFKRLGRNTFPVFRMNVFNP